VLLMVGVEMGARRFEGRLALADFMDMEGMNALGRALQNKSDQDTLGRIGKRGASDRLAVRRAEVGLGGVRGLRRRDRQNQSQAKENVP
jgi:hypothetical protein